MILTTTIPSMVVVIVATIPSMVSSVVIVATPIPFIPTSVVIVATTIPSMIVMTATFHGRAVTAIVRAITPVHLAEFFAPLVSSTRRSIIISAALVPFAPPVVVSGRPPAPAVIDPVASSSGKLFFSGRTLSAGGTVVLVVEMVSLLLREEREVVLETEIPLTKEQRGQSPATQIFVELGDLEPRFFGFEAFPILDADRPGRDLAVRLYEEQIRHNWQEFDVFGGSRGGSS